jgi:hypothetical protein
MCIISSVFETFNGPRTTKGGTDMEIPIYKIYKKVFSLFVVRKNMVFFKRHVKSSDTYLYDKAHTVMKQPWAHNEYSVPEEREMEKSSSQIFRSIHFWPNMSLAPDPCIGSEPSLVNGDTHKKVTFYKMGEYKITENNSDDLQWEMHFGMGALKEGKCFRKGQILFLGPARDERSGFFKGEFLDHIKPFPCWLKTRYYCPWPHIRRCDTGKKVSEYEMLRWENNPEPRLTRKAGRQKNHPHLKINGPDENTIEVSYSLNDHEIVKKGNGMVLWKRSGTLNRVNSGRCIIMEDILFIGPSENEPLETLKRQFHERLNLLPKWDDTEYYSCDFAILECNPAK